MRDSVSPPVERRKDLVGSGIIQERMEEGRSSARRGREAPPPTERSSGLGEWLPSEDFAWSFRSRRLPFMCILCIYYGWTTGNRATKPYLSDSRWVEQLESSFFFASLRRRWAPRLLIVVRFSRLSSVQLPRDSRRWVRASSVYTLTQVKPYRCSEPPTTKKGPRLGPDRLINWHRRDTRIIATLVVLHARDDTPLSPHFPPESTEPPPPIDFDPASPIEIGRSAVARIIEKSAHFWRTSTFLQKGASIIFCFFPRS